MDEHLEVSLVLGSTTYWPIYIGLLEVWDREEIPFSQIVASGSGAWWGGMYATRLDVQWLKEQGEEFVSQGGWKFFDFELHPLHLPPARWKTLLQSDPAYPFTRGEMVDFLPRSLLNIQFYDTLVHLAITALDCRSGQEVLIQSGEIAEAILSSATFPGYVPPREYQEGYLVDPYLHNRSPVSLALEFGADLTIAIDLPLNPPFLQVGHQLSPFEVLSRLYQFQTLEFQSRQISQADLIMAPEFERRDSLDLETYQYLVEVGHKMAEEHLAPLHKLIENRRTNHWRKLEDQDSPSPKRFP